jgi:hypothetical protein
VQTSDTYLLELHFLNSHVKNILRRGITAHLWTLTVFSHLLCHWENKIQINAAAVVFGKSQTHNHEFAGDLSSTTWHERVTVQKQIKGKSGQ